MRGIRLEARVALAVSAVALFGCATAARAEDYVDPARLARLVSGQGDSYLLLDVRTPGEYRAGHIPTAVNIPYDLIGARMPAVAKDAMIIVYCASGARAAIATRTLAAMGYTNVADFGALSRWQGKLDEGPQ